MTVINPNQNKKKIFCPGILILVFVIIVLGGVYISEYNRLVNLNYDISIEKDENVKRLNKFYSEVSIIPECCIPVQVDGNCKAKESSNVVSCGRLFKIDQGESLEMDGECSAC